jgi:hypothetical protein
MGLALAKLRLEGCEALLRMKGSDRPHLALATMVVIFHAIPAGSTYL